MIFLWVLTSRMLVLLIIDKRINTHERVNFSPQIIGYSPALAATIDFVIRHCLLRTTPDRSLVAAGG